MKPAIEIVRDIAREYKRVIESKRLPLAHTKRAKDAAWRTIVRDHPDYEPHRDVFMTEAGS